MEANLAALHLWKCEQAYKGRRLKEVPALQDLCVESKSIDNVFNTKSGPQEKSQLYARARDVQSGR